MPDSPSIPNHLLFVWYGKHLPFSCELAMRSAIHHCRPDKVFFFYEGLESELPRIKKEFKADCIPCSEVRQYWFKELPLDPEILSRIYDTLISPAARSNLVRLVALWKLGGVYLDTDTLTIRDLGPLRQFKGFCGLEPVALPSDLFLVRNPLPWVAATLKLAIREICARLPRGYLLFFLIQNGFSMRVNNAILGSVQHNPLLEKALEFIETIPPQARIKRFRLGTHLLQKITNNQTQPNMTVLSADVFYPLGPEISAHWFKSQPPGSENRLITQNTKVIHWYHSVEKRFLKRDLTPELIVKHPDWPFSRIAGPWLKKQGPL